MGAYLGQPERLVVGLCEFLHLVRIVLKGEMVTQLGIAYIDIGNQLIDIGTVEMKRHEIKYTPIRTCDDPFLRYQ